MNQKPAVINHFLLLDESNYMQLDQMHIIHQVNQTIHSIRAEALRNSHQLHKLTILTCNQERIRCLYTRVDAFKAQLIRKADYCPTASSNILDALGSTIGAMRVHDARFNGGQFHCTIFSNGIDNASSKYTSSMIASLVIRSQKKGWIFSVVGAGKSAEKWAQSLGISICCQVKSTDPVSRKQVVLKMMKRRWLLDQESISGENQGVEAA